jgi:ent-copalyl diphosphate synthase
MKLSEYSQLEKLTYSICSKLGSRILSQVCACIITKLLCPFLNSTNSLFFFFKKTFKVNQNGTTTENTENLEQQVDQEMQELAQCVFQSCDAISRVTKQTFLHVTRSYCYVAHSSPETIDSHISKVIFEDVV